ncbi:NAF1, H/ACA ribonucleoprotein complex non-core subunit NAF1 [Babesia microti strain RI]|uniref:H/ACA ribonucleoprotein complex subunit n=1 Tax=Babesia microti (strain RI) TaxID=1133968 RepID=A0A1R4ACA2_BABMR|nr:NAF1, H/ACA ribonucleoprotein complex non-core subunit NAF1 [Babesia microti strain RI]SJK86637.1 NAF1, H/ACA ribonucleoprotein complex non-core subunit NAF1 [Babesia microti strain RI]|eukprot:XP_021338771.1 NAF1, H/ACA ribonucleoprotein complex non-core subunit NAF1 [Babesia microti strain RI]
MSEKIVIDGQNERDDLYLVSHIAQIENAKLTAIDASNKSRPRTYTNSEDFLRQIGLLGLNLDGAFDSISDDEVKEYPTLNHTINTNESDICVDSEKKITNLDDITNIEIINLPKIVPEALEIKKIGVVTSQVESSIIVHSFDKSIPFDLGSIVCLSDRTIIGTITDVFGPVTSHYYRVNLVNPSEQSDIVKGTDIFCDVAHSTLVTNEVDSGENSDCDNSSVKTRSNITINYDKLSS